MDRLGVVPSRSILTGVLVVALVLGIGPLQGMAALAVRSPVGSPADSSGTPSEFVAATSPESARAAGLTVVGEVGFGWTLVSELVRSGVPPAESAAELATLTGLVVEPNYLYPLADEPLFPDQWSLENTGQSGGKVGADIDIERAWNFSIGVGVIIAVLDTGVAANHPDLSPNVWANTDEVGGNGLDDDGNGYDDDVHGWDALDGDADPTDTHGHGTFVATIAAAAMNDVGMAGVAPDAAVMPVRVCDINGCPLSAVLTGLDYAIVNGADVVNLSFGSNSSASTLMRSAIGEAVDAGITVVAAAGNQARDNDLLPFFPASYDIDGLISVAASDNKDVLAAFSNFGPNSVDLVAPGQDVLGGALPTAYGIGSGTSFASPHVAGVVALIKSVRPDLSPPELAALVTATVDTLSSLSGVVSSGGRVNAGSAVKLAVAPMAVAQSFPPSGTLPFSVQLNGSDSWDPLGTVMTWSWELPDGSVVAGQTASWSPKKPGTYRATLTVGNAAGLSDSAVVTFSASLRPGGTFIDDNGHFAEGAIEGIFAEGITRGCDPPINDRFCPHGVVTRGQIAAFLARALKLPAATTDFFVDDDGSVFESSINRLAAAGVTVGCNPPLNDRYCPDRSVTRGELAAFLARAFEVPGVAGSSDFFIDDDISIFEVAINRIAGLGITTGCNPPANDRYCPRSGLTRGELAVFLSRALGLRPFYPPPIG